MLAQPTLEKSPPQAPPPVPLAVMVSRIAAAIDAEVLRLAALPPRGAWPAQAAQIISCPLSGGMAGSFNPNSLPGQAFKLWLRREARALAA